jgi:hypothetical protein
MDDTLFYLVRNGQRGPQEPSFALRRLRWIARFPVGYLPMQMNVQIGCGTGALHERDRTLRA